MYTRSIVTVLRRAMSSSAGTSAPVHLASNGQASGVEPKAEAKSTGLVMQIILRRDLITKHDWPLGPMMAQAAHAATAVQHLHASHPDMKRYLAGEDERGWEVMRKAVLEIPDESAIRGLADKLEVAGIPHHLWVEEPEHTPTALALVPNKRPKSLKKILDEAGCTLWR